MKEIVSASAGTLTAEDLIPRDQWDRPLILPRSGHEKPCVPRTGRGGGCKCMTGYTRCSSLGEALSDSYGLNRWQKGNMLKGIKKRPDLVQAIHVVQTAGELYEIVDLLEQLGDNDVAARNGTTFHRLSDKVDRGEELPEGLPDNLKAMLSAYTEAMADWEVLDQEQFIVQDGILCAGTYDKRMRRLSTGEVRIGDVKTGQNLDRLALKTPIQVSIYDAGMHYDIGTGERSSIGVSGDHARGVLIWVPWVDDWHDARCELRWLDLQQGRLDAKMAVKVRKMRTRKAKDVLPRIRG